jgi:hypothetical protein
MKAKYIFFLLGVIIVSGCKKLVNVDPPVTKMVTTSVFASNNTAIAAQLAVYAQMQASPWTLDYYTALSSDEFVNYSTNTLSKDLYLNQLTASNDGASLPWGLAYKFIYQENAVIENVQVSDALSGTVRQLMLGEAKFIRAYWYFYLINLYGDVPLIMSTDYKVNSVMHRTPKAEVYQQVVQDLKNAESSLSKVYVDASDTISVTDRVRPTSWAASALLARVYLYEGKYDSAEAESSIVINNTSLYRLPALDSVFLKNSAEAIWQIQPPSANLYTYEGINFTLTGVPGGSSTQGSSSLSPQLLAAFESGDNRKSHWVGTYKSGLNTWYYENKYKDNAANTKTLTAIREYSMVLRIGELVLIRAEARAQQNKLSGAISDVNAIRARAGLPALSPTITQSQLLSAIAHERQVELFGEADRWFDLKKSGTIDAVMANVSISKQSSWNSYDQLYPISSAELQSGINLSQNQGY